jgi:hypothetical protein
MLHPSIRMPFCPLAHWINAHIQILAAGVHDVEGVLGDGEVPVRGGAVVDDCPVRPRTYNGLKADAPEMLLFAGDCQPKIDQSKKILGVALNGQNTCSHLAGNACRRRTFIVVTTGLL